MEESSRRFEPNDSRRLNWLTASLMVVVVFLEVVTHWHAFAAVSKFNAIVLLGILAYTPRALTQAEERSGSSGIARLIPYIYIPVMLATMLFARS
jgi:hypothetical protein